MSRDGQWPGAEATSHSVGERRGQAFIAGAGCRPSSGRWGSGWRRVTFFDLTRCRRVSASARAVSGKVPVRLLARGELQLLWPACMHSCIWVHGNNVAAEQMSAQQWIICGPAGRAHPSEGPEVLWWSLPFLLFRKPEPAQHLNIARCLKENVPA